MLIYNTTQPTGKRWFRYEGGPNLVMLMTHGPAIRGYYTGW